MDNQQFTLVGIGEILWDMLPEGKKLGGAPANFAYNAQALGGTGLVVSCIGDDSLGREIEDRMQLIGLKSDFIAVHPDFPTGRVTVDISNKRAPHYTIHENVAWDAIPLNDELLALANRCDAVCFGSLAQRSEPSRSTIRAFLNATRPECYRIFDINLRQHYYDEATVTDMLKCTSILKLNNDELPRVARLLGIEGDETKILTELVSRFDLKLIVLTKGEHGSRLFGRQEDSRHPGITSHKVVDTVGAGDAFTAAVTIGLLLNRSLDEINAQANRVATFVCSKSGATPPFPKSLRYS